MDHHRYGRHGPRAWLRWRERRYGRPSRLPVPVVPQPTIVRVHVPINAERIIFIVIQGAQDPNEENPHQQIIEMPTGQSMPTAFSFVPSSSDTGEMKRIGRDETPLARMSRYGERQARQDIGRIKRSYDLGQPITVRWDIITTRNEILAQNVLWEKVFLDDSSPDEREKQDLIGAYQQTYKEELDKSLKYYQLEAITNAHVARIRQIAMQDRIDFPKRDDRGFHQRDLGMIRVLLELEIPLDRAIDHLPEIHELADEYDKYYANPREGVDWPSSQEAFPELI